MILHWSGMPMSERCDICGVAAREEEHFTEEQLPLCRSKCYCPSCLQRFYYRIFAGLAMIPVVICGAGIVDALHRHTRMLDSELVCVSLLVMFQWVMTFPHELGHAIAGRVLGFQQIRILVGSGKPLFSFQFFGIPTLISLIPLGGLTLSGPVAAPSRWRYLAFVAAGPLVNLLVVGVSCWAIPSGRVFTFPNGSAASIFFWANVIVIAENLIPYQAITPFGTLPNDGLLLWKVLFRWDELTTSKPARVPAWEFGIRHMLKWTVFSMMAGATMFFVAIGILPFLGTTGLHGWEIKLLLPMVMSLLALVSGWAAWRVVKHPIPPTAIHEGMQQSLPLSSEQMQRLAQAIECAQNRNLAEAERLVDELLSAIPDTSLAGCWPLVQLKLRFIVVLNDVSRAENICREWVSRAPTIEDKIRILDFLSCQLLFESSPPVLDTAERLARQALELAPTALTLKGTLGGILAEQGRFAEAEPLLQECLKLSTKLHDKGISSFYLSLVKLASGDRSRARELIKRSMIFHPEPWLLSKARRKLAEMD